jgi:hypothetical protein
MKRLIVAGILALLSASANAQTCNSSSGFLKSFGTITIGDNLALGPDCEHVTTGNTGGADIFTRNIYTGAGVVAPNSSFIELGFFRTGDGSSFIDFHSQAGIDYNVRFVRDPGANGDFHLYNNGSGLIELNNLNGGAIDLVGTGDINFRNAGGNIYARSSDFYTLRTLHAFPTAGLLGFELRSPSAGNGLFSGSLGQLHDGSIGTPHTAQTPSISIYRREAVNSAVLAGNYPALWVEVESNNTGVGNPNGNAIIGRASQYGVGDIVGVVGSGLIQVGAASGHFAFGGNFDAESYIAGSGGFAIESFTANRTGTDYPYTGPIPLFTGVHVAAGGTNLNTAGIWINSLTAATAWSVGIAFTEDSIRTSSLQDDSLSPTIFKATSNHTNGIDFSGAVFTGCVFKGPSFCVTNAGIISNGIWGGNNIGTDRGGTGLAAFAIGDLMVANAASGAAALSRLADIATGNVLLSGGVGVSPSYGKVTSAHITAAALTKTDDTNVTVTLGGTPSLALVNAASLTLGWTGTLSMARGGSGAALTASTGGIVYSGASAMAVLSGTATANLPLLSGASAAPAWAAVSYPASGTSGGVAFFSSANVMATSAALAVNQIMIGGGAGAAPSTFACATSTTVVHGGTPPSCSQVSLTGDVSGILGVANGGANLSAGPSYAVTVGCNGGGSPGTSSATGHQITNGKLILVQIDIASSGVVTCGTGYSVTLPVAPLYTPTFSGINKSTNSTFSGYAPTATVNSVVMVTAATTGQFLSLTGTYEGI